MSNFYISNSWLLGEDSIHCLISYHRQQKAEAIDLGHTLEGLGFKVCLETSSKHHAGGAKNIAAQINQESEEKQRHENFKRSEVVAICFSDAYKADANCKDDTMRAVNASKPIILARMQPTCFLDGWLLAALGARAGRCPLIDMSYSEGHYGIAAALKEIIEQIILEKVSSSGSSKTPSKPSSPSNRGDTEIKTKIKDLWNAVQLGDAAKIKKVVESVAEGPRRDSLLETRGDDKWNVDTPLLRAARCGKAEALEALIALGADVTTKNKLGYNALHLGAGYGHDGVVKALLKDGSIEIDSPGQWNRTALALAVSQNHKGVVKLLLHHGTNLEARGGHFERTPLAMAAQFGRNDIIDILCEAGANVTTTDVDGEGVLHLAATAGKCETARLLITTWKAPIEATDFDDWTPLLTAAGEGKENFVSMMLNDFNASYKVETMPERHTLLHIAAEFGNRKVIDIVVEYLRKRSTEGMNEADALTKMLNWRNAHGDTPLHVACAHGEFDAVKALVEAGAKLSERNEENATAVTLARDFMSENKAEEVLETCNTMIKWLLSRGAPDL